MPITFTPAAPGDSFGPGYAFTVTAPGLPVIDLPWTWQVVLRDGSDNVFLFSQQRVDQTGGGATFRLLWDPDQRPSQLLSQFTLPETTQAKMTIEVHNNAQLPIETPLVVQKPWSQVVNLHANTYAWNQYLLDQIASSAGTGQLDRIESAVYQVFPHA